MSDDPRSLSRRDFLRAGGRGAAMLGLGVGAAAMAYAHRDTPDQFVWQIDPAKCIACGNCEINCVLEPSAVKCLHTFAMCGRCNFCFGYYDLRADSEVHSGAEYQICPTDAIERSYLGGPYFEYHIDEEACIACGLCVKGCVGSGNGSLHLQVRHPQSPPAGRFLGRLTGRTAEGEVRVGTCVNCNECSIAVACPAGAFERVPAAHPYPFRHPGGAKG